MALYILVLLLSGLVAVSLVMHYGLAALDLLPQAASGQSPAEQDHFTLNYGFILNIFFILVSTIMVWLRRRGKSETDEHDHKGSASLTDRFLQGLTIMAIIWLTGGLLIPFIP
jgi:heme/copper-type cytochrome/quinol oxidase subunit 2